MIHDGMLFCNLLFKAFPRIKIIEMEKNPIEIAFSWIKKKYEGGFEKNLRSTTMAFNYKNSQISYYIRRNFKEYLSLNKYDRVVFALIQLDLYKKKSFLKLNKKNKKKILKIKHSDFVCKTSINLKKLESFLKNKKTLYTSEVLKKINCPRKVNTKELNDKRNFLQKKLSKKYFKLIIKLENNFIKIY